MELYKVSEEFEEEVFESSDGAYDYAFSQCHNLIKKLYPKVDISKITSKVAVEKGVKRDLESSPEVVEPAKESGRSLIEMNRT